MATTASVLALPSGDRSRPRNLLSVGAVLAGTSLAMVFAGLAAAYIAVRTQNRPWPPEGVEFDNYLPNTLSITLLMAAVVVEWTVWALRRDERGQVTGGVGVLTFLGLAFVNLLWYTGSELGYGPADSAYAVLVWPMLILIGVAVGVGVVLALATLARVYGGHVTPRRPDAMRAVGLYWHFVLLSWLIVYATVFIKK